MKSFSTEIIYEHLKNNKDIYEKTEAKALIKKLPFLIRTNGLINVLEYLNKDKEYYRKSKEFLLDTLGYNERKIYNLDTDEYIFVSKQAYDLFVSFRSIYLAYQSKEGGEGGESRK